jgi:hypothetical protein
MCRAGPSGPLFFGENSMWQFHQWDDGLFSPFKPLSIRNIGPEPPEKREARQGGQGSKKEEIRPPNRFNYVA